MDKLLVAPIFDQVDPRTAFVPLRPPLVTKGRLVTLGGMVMTMACVNGTGARGTGGPVGTGMPPGGIVVLPTGVGRGLMLVGAGLTVGGEVTTSSLSCV